MPSVDGLTRGVLFATCFCAIGGFGFGIDNGWWGVALGLTNFNSAFGSLVTVTDGIKTVTLSSVEQSTGTSLGSAEIMIGALLTTPINRYYGRRAAIAMMSFISLIGVIIQITASVAGFRFWQLVAGKLILSIAMGVAANVVPTYQSELAPAKFRAAVINLYQTIQVCGVIAATAAVYALSSRNTIAAWQVPIGLQFIAPTVLLSGIYWMPESPRWLVWQGRTEEARDILVQLHAGGDPTYSADDDVAELVVSFEAEKALMSPAILDVFKGSDLRRTLISVGVQCLQQAQGSGYMTSYIVLFLTSLGLGNIFQNIMILYCVYLAGIMFSFILPDYFGRRPMLIWGAAICGSCLIIVSSLNVGISPATVSSQKASLGLIFIWYFVFGVVWSPLTWITSAEGCSARVREPTLTLATFMGFGVGLAINLVSPYIQNQGYGNLGGSIGFIWGGFTIISVAWTYFMVPEMRGLSLERLDYLFDHGVPTRRFQNWKDGLDQEADLEAVGTIVVRDTGRKESFSRSEEDQEK